MRDRIKKYAWLLRELALNALEIMGTAFLWGAGLLLALLLFANLARSAEVPIPRAAQQYRAELVRSAHATWGMNAPIAVFAAQVHTESWWKNDTVSSVGAQGLAQFMPSTARWLPTVAPETGEPAPFNPGWSLRALCTYDKWLWDRISAYKPPLYPVDRMKFTLSAYNGGLGWVKRDRALAREKGLSPDRWSGHVETVNAGRRASAIRENRRYVELIFQRQYAYIRAGWGPGIEDGARP